MKATRSTVCLVIILVMALGMIPPASAYGFTDSDQIRYKEAVDVLAGIGVIEGFPGGIFAPLDGVTRAQAAAILARMLLGKSAADALSDAPTGFPDVDGVSGVGFAVKYISYCVSQDIVVGHSDGRFRPNDSVTASQFAVMLMRALKIGDPDRYVGPEWEIYAILYGTENNLLDSNVDNRLPANREQTARYAFNGLLHSPGGQSADIAQDSLAAKVYPTLQKKTEGVDVNGQPGIIWTYGASADVIHSSVAVPAGNTRIALVIGFDSKTTLIDGQPSTTYSARIVNTDGETFSVPTSAAIFNESGRDAKYRGVVCSYTVDANDQHIFTAPPVSSPGDYLIDAGITGIVIRSEELRGGSTVKLANESTRFVVVSFSGSGSAYGPSGSVVVYNGISQVPTLNLLTRTTAVSLRSGSSGPDEVAEVVFIYDDIFGAAKDSYIFVTGSWAQTTTGYLVEVIAKGLRASIRAKDITERDKLLAFAGSLLKDVRVETDGAILPGDVLDDKWDAESSISTSDGFLFLDGVLSGLTVADDVPVYTITIKGADPADVSVSTGAATDLRHSLTLADNDFAYVTEYNGVVSSIYIIVGAS